MSQFPQIEKGKYRHSKSGKLYEVIGVALQTEIDEPLVIYSPLYDCRYELLARPYSMFFEEVEIDSNKVLRFEKVSDES